ncbi:MAG TPA: UDP-N-acetylmuramoyl-L-alanyl-D-glutamate--2,6-diaminopimelate ligase [Burkholderiales bacterium]|nr:UDP-N-acetylmuramoyl-L-alanyl-D-glutamate--2,6-diaminopimelate ligase [Burkholderiales bacterium]
MAAEAFVFMRRLAKQGVHVSGLRSDSRFVQRGDVFLAYPGELADGRRYIRDAVQAGASAVIWEREGFAWEEDLTVPNLSVDNLKAFAGLLADEVYGHPSHRLDVVAVTGTNGKTSCSMWIAQALQATGERTAVIGTLGFGYPGDLESNPNTTPDALLLQQTLKRFADDGARTVAMEASSIGLEQGRINGVRVHTALFTNLSRDHLDYHADMEAYVQAKMLLFKQPGLQHAVLNLDDVQAVRIAQMLGGEGIERVGYSMVPGAAERGGVDRYLEAHDIALSDQGLRFTLASSWGRTEVVSPLLGRFNVANLLGVLGVLLSKGLDLNDAVSAVQGLRSVAGRMQRLGGGAQPLVVIDYAHTPDALEKVLSALADIARAQGGRLLCLFGCGGDRDKGKRALMGEAASRYADKIVVTSDNPRSENPQAIIDDILPGVRARHEVQIDRRMAIHAIVSEAKAGDVVLLAGKGHETYQEINGTRLPFSDLDEASAVLAAGVLT